MRVALDTHRLWQGHGTARTWFEDLLPRMVDVANEGRAEDGLVVLHDPDDEIPAWVSWLLRNDSLEKLSLANGGHANRLLDKLPFRKSRLPKEAADVDLTHSLMPPLLATDEKPSVLTMPAVLHPDENMPRAVRDAIARADALVVPSQSAADCLVDDYEVAPEQIRVIRPGVHTRYLEPPKTAEMVELCERYPFLEEPYILTLGASAEPARSAPFLIDAWTSAKNGDASLPPLVLVAPSGALEALVKQVESTGNRDRIFVLENLDKNSLPALYRGAEFMLQLCLDNTFGQSMLEAAACGVPALADPRCGALEIVEAGTISPGTNLSDWAGAIVDLHQDEGTRQHLGNSARRATKDLTWERAAREHWELYGQF